MDSKKLSLCRICLVEGATFPIFEPKDNDDNIHSKLLFCLHEKVEDTKGYPRNICKSCNEILDNVCNFINKYKETCSILTKSLVSVKKENLDYNDLSKSHNDFSEVEIDFSDIKIEKIDVNDNINNELESLLKLKSLSVKKVKNKHEKKLKRKRRPNGLSKIKTNKIASSVLEGDFIWNGESLSSKDYISKASVKLKKDINSKQTPENIKKFKEQPVTSSKLCDLCGEVFENSEKLSIHKKKSHFQKPVKCPKCPRICCSEYYLGRHLLRKHNDAEKNFTCSSCGARFAFKGELTSHIKNVHEKDLRPKKIYACKICNKNYKCAKSVVVHERSVHTGLRPAVCSICGNSFYHDDYLKEHMRLHTGETPFKCPVCGRGYAQRCNMKSHLRIHRVSEIDPLTLSKMRPNYVRLLKKI